MFSGGAQVFFPTLYHFVLSFSSPIFFGRGLLAQGFQSLPKSLGSLGPFYKMVSVSKPSRFQDIPVVHRGPSELPYFGSSQGSFRSPKSLYRYQDGFRPHKNMFGTFQGSFMVNQNMVLVYVRPLSPQHVFGLRALSNHTKIVSGLPGPFYTFWKPSDEP